jgi:hypothetical protein
LTDPASRSYHCSINNAIIEILYSLETTRKLLDMDDNICKLTGSAKLLQIEVAKPAQQDKFRTRVQLPKGMKFSWPVF